MVELHETFPIIFIFYFLLINSCAFSYPKSHNLVQKRFKEKRCHKCVVAVWLSYNKMSLYQDTPFLVELGLVPSI